MRMSTFSGQQLAQVNNPDPFAAPVWRSPVYHTPGWLITLVQLVRVLAALVRFLARHPLLDLAMAVLAFTYSLAGWPGPPGSSAQPWSALLSASMPRASAGQTASRPA